MTHFLQRSALILLTTTALCATPALARTHHSHGHKAAAAPKAANGKIVTLNGDRAAYVVKKGDTLEKIADKLDTTVLELQTVNKLKKRHLLQPGDVLKGPPVTKKAYVVANGDTIYSIAQRFHVSVEELRDENDLSPRTHIRPGQKIRLPADYRAPKVLEAVEGAAEAAPAAGKGRKGRAASEPAAEPAPAGVERTVSGRVTTIQGRAEHYKVRRGDTLAKVADRLDTDIGQLKALNHLRGNTVHAGQVLRGPSFTEHVYTAEAGDTLAGIAERFGVSVERLRAENDMSRRVRTVRPGQKIYLPDGYRDREGGRSEPAPAFERPARSYPSPRNEPPGPATTQIPSHPVPYGALNGPRAYVPPPSSSAPAASAQPNTPAPSDAQVSQMGKGRFQWPARGEILSDFGVRAGGQHNDGIDIQAAAGSPVRAAADGDVVYAGDQVPGFGNLVLIKHADGWVTAYGHLSRTEVRMQQKVTQGQEIGQAGTTGGAPEPQVHFEVRYAPNPLERARPVDPKLVLPK